MLRIVISIFMAMLFPLTLLSQTTRTTDCGIFSFTYPSSMVSSNVEKQPGYVMALESEKCFISASMWDFGIVGMSIWDDEIISELKKASAQGVKVLKVEKVTINTKSGKRRSVRTLSNMNKNGWEALIIQYSFIHKENLINVQFVFSSEFSQIFSVAYADHLIEGIRFK